MNIEKYARIPGVKRIAVENFLSTASKNSFFANVKNLEQDARAYRWNYATERAIYDGLLEMFEIV